MKNASLKPNTDSPKTPGGISKSLLTPCRRVGLSRKWRKSTVSPFTSPATSNNEETSSPVARVRKRKNSNEASKEPDSSCESKNDLSIDKTPSRTEIQQNKKSKLLVNCISDEINAKETINESKYDSPEHSTKDKALETPLQGNNEHKEQSSTEVATPVRLKSKSRSKKKSPKKVPEKENVQETKKEVSPNNLTKECIVVIQKKIFKKELNNKSNESNNKTEKPAKNSQSLFDSDTDDVPLSKINKTEINTDSKMVIPTQKTTTELEYDDFTTKIKPSQTKQKLKQPENIKAIEKDKPIKLQETSSKSQRKSNINSQLSDDDDDDFMDNKRTIVIKKTYTKITKPTKAKSTGSITQKDIDNLKSRIEAKKKMLLAKAMTEDTKEVRDLIKKWQKGCQDALMELMDIMKNKLPDKKNMGYSEMLKTLKIPSNLVGYDSDNDCFLTPEDKDIILADL